MEGLTTDSSNHRGEGAVYFSNINIYIFIYIHGKKRLGNVVSYPVFGIHLCTLHTIRSSCISVEVLK